jgi:hypothetical protein
LNDTAESEDGSSGTHAWDLQKTRRDVDSKCRDSHNILNLLNIRVSPPYLKPSEVPVNEFGLPNKAFYTTADICKVLKMHNERIPRSLSHDLEALDRLRD